MKTYLLSSLFSALFLISFAQAQTETSQIEVFARIQTAGHAIKLIRSNEGDVIPSVLKDKNLEKIISTLSPGDEALVKGHITYQPRIIEGRTNLDPIFVIESITPISLKRLGELKGYEANDLSPLLFTSDRDFSPLTIPISTEVASAITLSTTILLMHSLTASDSQPQVSQQLNSGLFLFAGALATGVFIYEQIKGINKK